MELNTRKQEILAEVIREYITTGEPVGSKSLCGRLSVSLSPASIRSQLSELCDMGLLTQPHTSAGRIPTALGYRYYIKQLMRHNSLSQQDKLLIDSVLPSGTGAPERIIESACEALAELTGCTAMLTTPTDRAASVKSVQLILIAHRTVMVVLITSTGIIKNRVARCDCDIEIPTLERIDNILRQEIYGVRLEDFNTACAQGILMKLGLDALSYAPIVAAVVDAVGDAIDFELTLKGESNLLSHREFSMQKAKLLLNFLHNRGSLLSILHSPQEDVSVLFGNETGESALSSSGVIVTHYSVGDRDIGSIGLLGPDRMDYEKIIPSVLYFRDSLGKLLTECFLSDI